MKQFRDTEYYVTEDGVVISKYLVGGANRSKKGKPSSNNERVVGRGTSAGYHTVRPRGCGGWYVHQMVMECYGPPKPDDIQNWVIDHIDENKLNNNITNLQWLTNGDNVSKSSYKQRHHSDELEQQIRDEYVPRVVTRKMLSVRYNIPLGTIKDILMRE